jgi:hypothetical protein
LQALTTLNDSAYLDLSRQFAYRILNETRSNDVKNCISRGYEIIMYRPVAPQKLEALVRLYNRAFDEFKNDPDKTCGIIGVNDAHNNPATAALVVVASALLNLDEVITKN